MRKNMLGVVVGIALAGWVLAGEHPEHPKSKAPAATKEPVESVGKLDGKVFAGELGKKGEKNGDKDEFVFTNGTFVSTACVVDGFKEAPYVATEKDGTIAFTSEPKNAKAEKMSWKGAVTNDVIEGTALYQAEASQIHYWFKGRLKSAAAAAGEQPESPKKPEHPEHPK